MANIEDYLIWRGDLTFKQASFNEVDNLILSLLAYVRFDGIVPGRGRKEVISLEEASELFFKMYTEKELLSEKAFTRMVPFLMQKLAKTRRFKEIGLCKYVNEIDYNEEKQFSAMHILLQDGTTYISYRGTDDTLVGWKEDLRMTYMMPVPAQVEALRYLECTTRWSRRSLRLGGHSKGGNLAIYAGVNCKEKLKHRIIEIYNNDGPGFNKEMMASIGYKQMLHRIKTIVPESSIVGMLLEHEEEYVVVKSMKSGIMQHDLMNWEVSGPNLVYLEHVSKNSEKLKYTLKAWLENLDISKREQFIEALFVALEATEAKTLSELTSDKLKNANIILKSLGNMDDTTKEMVTETVKLLANEYYKVFMQTFKKKQDSER